LSFCVSPLKGFGLFVVASRFRSELGLDSPAFFFPAAKSQYVQTPFLSTAIAYQKSMQQRTSASACTPVCRVHAAYQLPLGASLKLDKLSEVCFSVKLQRLLSAAAPRNKERI